MKQFSSKAWWFFQLASQADHTFYDTFVDTAGTALASHTPDQDDSGNGWTDTNSKYEIATSGEVTHT